MKSSVVWTWKRKRERRREKERRWWLDSQSVLLLCFNGVFVFWDGFFYFLSFFYMFLSFFGILGFWPVFVRDNLLQGVEEGGENANGGQRRGVR
jgi:hypothetical protein